MKTTRILPILIGTFLAVLLLRSFLVEPFRIPSGSMMPTLLVGDFILVNKFSYDIRLPVLNRKVVELGQPERGDVVVFRYPKDPSVDYIKRVVGVPGDEVYYRDKTLFVNGEPVAQTPIGTYRGVGSGRGMTGAGATSTPRKVCVRDEMISRRADAPSGIAT